MLWRLYLGIVLATLTLNSRAEASSVDPYWQNAIVYFLMTDRFYNGDPSNDVQFGRKQDGAVLRNFMGGDIRGVTQKIEEGYFNNLGVDAIWMTPIVEQIHGVWPEDWGKSYPFHGYWILDWTKPDPNFGSEQDYRDFVDAAHRHGIRVIADVVLNHTGPKTQIDPAWPNDWIRTQPICDWQDFSGNVDCAIAPSLTDILTDTKQEVELPDFLIDKWKEEGRLEQELNKLDVFFEQTKLPRYPHNYIIAWLSDWVEQYGIDGFRVDTAKHVEPEVWPVLKEHSAKAFERWKRANPGKKIDDKPFFMMGEVYNFGLLGFNQTVESSREFDFGDRKVDFYDYGFEGLINMGFATHASMQMPELFNLYADAFNKGAFQSSVAFNYIASHDDGAPFDQSRSKPYEAANKLLLAPGAVQIYYGDEIARPLKVEGTVGDATLREFMNWQDLESKETQALLKHWQILAKFRQFHPAVGAGRHRELSREPYSFSRELGSDKVVVLLNPNANNQVVSVAGVFEDGSVLRDVYTGKKVVVRSEKVEVDQPGKLILLELH
jgi:alpha-amylase